MSTLIELFTNIADAIRTKKGTTDKIKASDFPIEIRNLPSGGGSDYNTIMDVNGLSTNASTSSSSYVLNKLIKKAPNIDTSGWTSTAYMFYKCSKLEEIPILDTSKVTNMNYMFAECDSLSKINLNGLDTSSVTSMQGMFNNCPRLEEIDISNLDISKVTTLNSMFNYCIALSNIVWRNFDTSSATDITQMFANTQLTDIPKLNGVKITTLRNAFNGCSTLKNFEGIEDLGKAYTQKTENYYTYKFGLTSCTALTHESLINIINKLYDLNLTYDVANGGTLYGQTLEIGASNLLKLTEEEIAIATSKGWNVS